MFALLLAGFALGAEPADLDKPMSVRVDSDATWGIGGQMFLGTQAHVVVGHRLWQGSSVSVGLDVGVQGAWHHEPVFMAPWIDPEEVQGAVNRGQVVLSAGPHLRFGAKGRTTLALHAIAGLNHWRSAYTLEYDAVDVSGSMVVRRTTPVVGGQLTLMVRASERVGVNLVIGAPAPLPSSYAVGMTWVGIGPSFVLR